MRMHSQLVAVLAVWSVAAPALENTVTAQTVVDSTSVATGRLFTKTDAKIAGGFALAAIAMWPLDKHFAQLSQDEDLLRNRILGVGTTGVEYIASPGAYFIGGAMYGAGRLMHSSRLTSLGWHGTEAVLIADLGTFALKSIAGRARPFVSSDTNPRDFSLGGGLGNSNRMSFPSGHTSTAFAAAAAVTEETSHWWPRSTWYIGPIMYGGATLVGLSRMYHNRHWASDVVLGAAIGTFAGLKVVQYAYAHPDNVLDRVMLHTSAAPTGGGKDGFRISWSVPSPW
jgi:membrane-associated phospholipid phosphatase